MLVSYSVTLIYLLAYPAAYVAVFFVFPYFFGAKAPKLGMQSVYSILKILAVFLLFFVLSEVVQDEELGNRILHSMAGGFTALVMCFYAASDSKVVITSFQFSVFSFLLVTTLGVGNEIAEFFGQRYTSLVFAPHINDTWLDLISNTVGALLGMAVLVPFFKKHDQSP